MKYESWCALSNDELAQRDVAEVHLTVALGLPYAGALDVSALRYRLPGVAQLESADSMGDSRLAPPPAEMASVPPEAMELALSQYRQAHQGPIWDEDAGMYFYRDRWYDPTVGRFIGEDPIGFEAEDTNLNRYVGNGATNATDPSGLYDGPVGAHTYYYEREYLDRYGWEHQNAKESLRRWTDDLNSLKERRIASIRQRAIQGRVPTALIDSLRPTDIMFLPGKRPSLRPFL